MVERVPQILKFVPHGKGRILVKRVYADENGPQLSAGMIRAGTGVWNVELDYPEITASFATLALAQAFCQGYSAAKGWTIPPDGTVSAQDAQDAHIEHLREYLALETPRSIQDAMAGRLKGADVPDLEMRLRKLEMLAHEHFVNTEDVKPSPGRGR